MSTGPFEIGAADIQDALSRATSKGGRLQLDPENVEQDLARLVLGLMAFLRELMELQAIRQMDAGGLSAQQEEKLGTTLMRAEAAIFDLADRFGLAPGDLALDLGPLGKTI